jgi:hypothetical protein
MTPYARECFLKYAIRLVKEGTSLLRKPRKNQRRSKTGVLFLDIKASEQWLVACRNIVYQLGAESAEWKSYFHSSGKNYTQDEAKADLGALIALHDAVKNDSLIPVELLSSSATMMNLILQLPCLLDRGYTLAAGWLCRVILETYLRTWCERKECIPKKKGSINFYAESLYHSKFISKNALDKIRHLGTIANWPSHNSQPPLPANEIKELAFEVTQFVVTHGID